MLHKLAGCGGNILRPQYCIGEGGGVQGQHGLQKALLQICPVKIKQDRDRQLAVALPAPSDVLPADRRGQVASDCDASFCVTPISVSPGLVVMHGRDRLSAWRKDENLR